MKLHHFHHSRLLRWIFRFRKRCGYGIHSPFAFNLVTGVLYEKGAYYAYEELTKHAAHFTSSLRLKDNRLLFRLANYHQPNKGLIFAKDFELSSQYLQYGRMGCAWYNVTTFSDFIAWKKRHADMPLDMVYIDTSLVDAKIWSELLPCCYDHTLIVFQGIHSSSEQENLWRACKEEARVRVTFDLYDFGLLFFEERLNKEDYIINYY